MAFDFSVQNNQFSTAAMQTAASAAGAGSIGSLLGQQVQLISSPLSMLADAAEEMTFAVDTTKEFELEERKDRDKVDEMTKKRVQLYQELMHKAGKNKQIDILKDSLQAKSGKDNALKEALRQFSDYTDAWASLKSIAEEFENDPAVSDGVKVGIREAIQELEEQHGAEIKTGLHGALSHAGFEDIGTSDDTRDLYRQVTFDFTSITNAFQYINEKYGGANFEKAMDFLFSSISSDISSESPSMDKTHLEFVHRNLGKVRLLQSAYAQCESLVNRWENEHKVTNSGLTSMDILSSVVAFRDINYLGAMHIEEIAQKAKAPDIEREVLFMQDFVGMLRQFPDKIYDDLQTYQKVMDAAQQALDKVIEREDEYLANLE